MRLLECSPRWLLTITLVLLCGGIAGAQSDQPSLGDVAKKNKQDSAGKKAKVVVTDDDLPASTGASSSTNAPVSQPGSAATVAGDKPVSDTKDDSAKGAKDAASTSSDDKSKPEDRQAAQQRAKALAEDEKALQEKYKKLQEKYDQETDPFRKMVMENELANSKTNMDALRQKRQDAERAAQGGPAPDQQSSASPQQNQQ